MPRLKGKDRQILVRIEEFGRKLDVRPGVAKLLGQRRLSMMHRDRAWRRRKAHFEHVREVETLEVKGFQLRDVPPKGLEEKHHPPGKLTVAQTLRLSSQLADELKEGEIRETLLETQPTDAVTEAAI